MRRTIQISRGLIILSICFFVSACSLSGTGGKLNDLDNKVGELFDEFQEEQVEETVHVMDDKQEKKDGELTKADKEKIDQWLKDNNLNRYGDPLDTFYIGGTPLFDEETGETIDRYDYILKNHPDILN